MKERKFGFRIFALESLFWPESVVGSNKIGFVELDLSTLVPLSANSTFTKR